MVTVSDDSTIFSWNPTKQTKPLVRMTDDQMLDNHIAFSPNSRNIVSASFDNSIELWDGCGRKFWSPLEVVLLVSIKLHGRNIVVY